MYQLKVNFAFDALHFVFILLLVIIRKSIFIVSTRPKHSVSFFFIAHMVQYLFFRFFLFLQNLLKIADESRLLTIIRRRFAVRLSRRVAIFAASLCSRNPVCELVSIRISFNKCDTELIYIRFFLSFLVSNSLISSLIRS